MVDSRKAAVPRQARASKAPTGAKPLTQEPDPMAEPETAEPSEKPEAPYQVQLLFYPAGDTDPVAVSRFEVTFHKDTPFYYPGSSVCDRQFDIRANPGPGKYTRPHALSAYLRSVKVRADGSFTVVFTDGKISGATASAVAAWSIEV